MTLLDTNVLLYATFEGFPEHARAREILREIAEDGVPHCTTWVNLFEYLRAATHRRMLRPAPVTLTEALDNVSDLLDHPSVARIDPGPRHLRVFGEICREAGAVDGNFVHDCRIAAIMRENGVARILTRDTSFRRIPGLEVIDPFASSSEER